MRKLTINLHRCRTRNRAESLWRYKVVTRREIPHTGFIRWDWHSNKRSGITTQTAKEIKRFLHVRVISLRETNSIGKE